MMLSADLIRCSLVLIGIWGLLSATQWLFDLHRWRDGGALGWDLHQVRRSRLLRSGLMSRLYASSGLRGVTIVQCATSVALILSGPSLVTLVWLAVFGLATMLLSLRAGPDGADKMMLVVVTGVLLQIMGRALDNPQLLLAGVLWTGGQLSIAYFASGASKLLLPQWRSGEAVAAALSSHTAGNRWSAQLVSKPRAALVLAWGIILVEALFPLALFAPPPVFLTVLTGFFLFHMAIAIVMGLNSYPWAFLAAYPSAIMLNLWLGSALGLPWSTV